MSSNKNQLINLLDPLHLNNSLTNKTPEELVLLVNEKINKYPNEENIDETFRFYLGTVFSTNSKKEDILLNKELQLKKKEIELDLLYKEILRKQNELKSYSSNVSSSHNSRQKIHHQYNEEEEIKRAERESLEESLKYYINESDSDESISEEKEIIKPNDRYVFLENRNKISLTDDSLDKFYEVLKTEDLSKIRSYLNSPTIKSDDLNLLFSLKFNGKTLKERIKSKEVKEICKFLEK
jgi:hypothetical protein